MKEPFGYLIALLLATSCSRPARLVDVERLLPFEEAKNVYFPKTVTAYTEPKGDYLFARYFPTSYFTKALRILEEESLVEHYKGVDIIRLTRTEALGGAYFMIRIERSNSDVSIIYKESHQLHTNRPGGLDTYNYDRLEYDSTTNEFQLVSYTQTPLASGGSGIASVTARKQIKPVLVHDVNSLNLEKWNHLIRLLNTNAYLKMNPVDSAARVDGHDYILELHTKEGYYVVDRFVPTEESFVEIVKYILGLAGKEHEM